MWREDSGLTRRPLPASGAARSGAVTTAREPAPRAAAEAGQARALGSRASAGGSRPPHPDAATELPILPSSRGLIMFP